MASIGDIVAQLMAPKEKTAPTMADWSGVGAAMPEAYGANSPIMDPIVRTMGSIATLPQRAMESSERMVRTGEYDPAPIVEAAMLPMGTGAIAGVPMRAGEAVLGAGPIRRMGDVATPIDSAILTSNMAPIRNPYLQPAVRVNGRVYKGDSHIDALSQLPPEIKANAQLDGSNRGWVSDRGRFLDREKAQRYAVDNDLIQENAPSWVRGTREAISEWIKPPPIRSAK